MSSSIATSRKIAGLFFVNSKIVEPSLTSDGFNHWYDSVHVPDILKTSGIKTAYRYFAVRPEQTERPFLACYPLKHIDFLESDEFHAIPVSSDLLPASGNSFDIASFDARPAALVKAFENDKSVKGMDCIIDFPSVNLTDGLLRACTNSRRSELQHSIGRRRH